MFQAAVFSVLYAGLLAGFSAGFIPVGHVGTDAAGFSSEASRQLLPARFFMLAHDRDMHDAPDQPPSSQAQTSGARVDLPDGVSLVAPRGWSQAGDLIQGRAVLQSSDGLSLMIASVDEGMLQQAVGELAFPVDLGDGIVLDPLEAPASRGQIYSNRFSVRGADMPRLATIMIREVGAGRTLTLIGIAPTGEAGSLQAALSQVITTYKVSAPRAQTASGWESQLKGRYLVKFYSGNGYSEKHELWLCSNGAFLKQVDGGGFTQGVASGAFAGGLQGTWRAQGAPSGAGVLILSTTDGQVLRYELQQRSDGVGIDGERWMRGDNQRCG